MAVNRILGDFVFNKMTRGIVSPDDITQRMTRGELIHIIVIIVTTDPRFLKFARMSNERPESARERMFIVARSMITEDYVIGEAEERHFHYEAVEAQPDIEAYSATMKIEAMSCDKKNKTEGLHINANRIREAQQVIPVDRFGVLRATASIGRGISTVAVKVAGQGKDPRI